VRDFVEGSCGEDVRGFEEEIAVAVGGIEAGGFEEDGAGAGFDEGAHGWWEGCPGRGVRLVARGWHGDGGNSRLHLYTW
jgi:hypothetical protein